MMDQALFVLFLMIGWHAIADVPLQTGDLSRAKRPGGSMPWPFATAIHAFIHGFGVAAITGLWWLGLAEVVAHALIDQGKARRRYTALVDQFLHLACKAAWTALYIVAVGA